MPSITMNNLDDFEFFSLANTPNYKRLILYWKSRQCIIHRHVCMRLEIHHTNIYVYIMQYSQSEAGFERYVSPLK